MRLYQTSEEDAAIRGGLGIGLNLCMELVKLHGGRLELESEVGQGSAFTFTLPVHANINMSPMEQPHEENTDR